MKLNIEDERKFLVKRMTGKYLRLRGKKITQWYIGMDPPVRVRVENLDECSLTIKIKARPGVNKEYIQEISFLLSERLAKFRKFNKIRKTRRDIGNLELDVFYVQLHDLVILEFENKTGKDTFVIPSDMVVEEVTGDERFDNHNLAKLDAIPDEWRCEIV